MNPLEKAWNEIQRYLRRHRIERQLNNLDGGKRLQILMASPWVAEAFQGEGRYILLRSI